MGLIENFTTSVSWCDVTPLTQYCMVQVTLELSIFIVNMSQLGRSDAITCHMRVTFCTIQWKLRLPDHENVVKLFCMLQAIWLVEKGHDHIYHIIIYSWLLTCGHSHLSRIRVSSNLPHRDISVLGSQGKIRLRMDSLLTLFLLQHFHPILHVLYMSASCCGYKVPNLLIF